MKRNAFFLMVWLATAAVLLSAATVVRAEVRTWTRLSDGAKIEAEFVRMKDNATAYLKRKGGATVEVPVAALSNEDRAYLSEKTGIAMQAALPAEETTVVLAGAHLCCGGCRDGVMTAVAGIEGLTVEIQSGNIHLKGGSGDLVKKGLDAIAGAGYYGVSDNEKVKMDPIEAEDDEKAKDSISVSGVHLCCGKCVRAIDDVVAAIQGAESHTAKVDATSFTIRGEGMKASAVLAALREEGLNGKVR
ncbi:MAG: hypothetical protein JNK37_14650 [Verrucomicrobiales bacterium]|nr:hypothetical protein [Verrucomicrobiales bacterium]